MIRNKENGEENSILPFLINPSADARGQVQFCQNSIVKLFEKGDSPCTKEFLDVKIKRQLLDHRNLQHYITIWNIRNRNQFTKLIS